MADDDNFDIDIYGDEQPEFVQEPADQVSEDPQHIQDHQETSLDDDTNNNYGQSPNEPETEPKIESKDDIDIDIDDTPDQPSDQSQLNMSEQPQEQTQQIASSTDVAGPQLSVPRQAPREQGAKREEGAEDTRDVDAGATAALKLVGFDWWMTEDDIRGWANQCEVENEVREITFNEHKVNGKSKGEVFIEVQSPQAATALKRLITSFLNPDPFIEKRSVLYVRPDYNPFKTYPKDAPARQKEPYKERQAGAYNPNFNNSGYRGGRGNFNNNRGATNNMGGYGGQARGGYQNPHPQMGAMGGYGAMNNMGAMGGMNMGGFGNQMGFNRGGNMMGMNRGGYAGNRGGRGGMMNNMGAMPQMGMGMGMGMGAMGNMGMMNGMGMPGGYPQGQFNAQFYAGGNQGQGMGGNPHGAKRPRPE